MAVLPHSVSVGSVVAHIHAHTALSSASKTAVLFVLHGHPSRARHMKPIVYGTFDLLVKKANIAPEPPKRNFVIVTFDLGEQGEDDEDEPECERLYRRQERITSSVSALIDTLPSVLNPNHDKPIDKWLVAGISLGAHAAWMAMDRDSRISACIPINGSPDFLDIASFRSNDASVPLVSSLMYPATRSHIIKHDPISRHWSPSRANPFRNKHVLALAGAQDSMAPLLATRIFMDRIDVGPSGTKRLVIQEGVGHQCTKDMVREMAEFIWLIALA